MDREWRVSVDLSQVDGMRTRMMGMSNAEVPRPALPSDPEGKISLKDVEEPVATVLQKAAELYKTFDKPLLEGYANVADFVKHNGVVIDCPQIVFVGQKGAGKTAVLEGILGHAVLNNAKNGNVSTERPIVIDVRFNKNCAVPRATVRKDAVSNALSKDTVIDVEDLPEILQKCNVKSTTPLNVLYESASMLDATFVDLPGLDDPENTELEELVAGYAASSGDLRNKLVICVERAGAWPSYMAHWAKKKGVQFSIGVYTEAKKHFESLGTGLPVTRFLNDKPQNHVHCAFVSVAAGNELAKDEFPQKFQARTLQCDEIFVKGLGNIDKRFERSFGMANLHAKIFQILLGCYAQLLPQLRQKHTEMCRVLESELADLNKKVSSFDRWKLSSTASSVVRSVFDVMTRLFSPDASISLASSVTFGQTLEQEQCYTAGGPWMADGLTFDAETMKIPYHNQALLGIQQFLRLLSEFKAVMSNCMMVAVTESEIISALGGGSCAGDNAKVVAVSCDLANKRINAQIRPLVQQFSRRVEYFMKRMFDVSIEMMKSEQKAAAAAMQNRGALTGSSMFKSSFMPQASTENTIDIEEYPLFTHWLSAQFSDFFDLMVKTFDEKCAGDFYDSRTLAWNVRLGEKDLAAPSDLAKVQRLTQKVFVEVRDRVRDSVLMKCHSMFSDVTQLSFNAQSGDVFAINDDVLEELFETTITVAKLQKQIEALQKSTDALQQKARDIAAAAQSFSDASKTRF